MKKLRGRPAKPKTEFSDFLARNGWTSHAFANSITPRPNDNTIDRWRAGGRVAREFRIPLFVAHPRVPVGQDGRQIKFQKNKPAPLSAPDQQV